MTASKSDKDKDNRKKRYRSRNDIIAELLKIALDRTTKTRMMYSAYLSYRQVEEYLPLLLGSGMLELDTKGKKYHTTKKGEHFLEIYERTKI